MSFEEKSKSPEVQLLEWLKSQSDVLRNNPELILQKIDEFGKTQRLVTIGPYKGEELIKQIKKKKPETVVEFGTYVGYSSILIAHELVKLGLKYVSKVFTFEVNEEFYNISSEIIKLSGLSEVIVQFKGKASDIIEEISEKHQIEKIDLLFFDHWKYFYLPDLRVVETLGLITVGTIILADKVFKHGASDYVEYVHASPFFKKTYTEKVKNVNGPHYIGKWGLVYESTTIPSVTLIDGEKDGVEVTKCVGILDA